MLANRHLVAITAVVLGVCLSGHVRAQSFDPLSIGRVVAGSGANISGELAKAAMANKTVEEGIESFRQSVGLKTSAVELNEKLRQPAGLCQTVESQSALAAGEAAAKAKVAGGQRSTFARPGDGSAAAAIESAYSSTGEKFCTPEESRLGVCKLSSDPTLVNLAGADQDAFYLFQGRASENTYDGGRDGHQAQAVDAYIRRVVVGVPTEPLRVDRKSYASNPQARAYVELERRYKAFLSMSSYSLNRIKESRNPSKTQAQAAAK